GWTSAPPRTWSPDSAGPDDRYSPALAGAPAGLTITSSPRRLSAVRHRDNKRNHATRTSTVGKASIPSEPAWALAAAGDSCCRMCCRALVMSRCDGDRALQLRTKVASVGTLVNRKEPRLPLGSSEPEPHDVESC